MDELLEQVKSGASAPGAVKNVHVIGQTQLTVNGVKVESLEQLPPELQQAVSRGLAVASQMGTQQAFQVSSSLTVSSDPKEQTLAAPSKTSRARWVIACLVGVVIMIAGLIVTAALQ